MGFDRLRREGSQIVIQDLENNHMLDIGKCHGACRHVQSVSNFAFLKKPTFQVDFSSLA